MARAPTPQEALDRAIGCGGFPSLLSSRRFGRYQGRPGEIIERLDAPTRAALAELRSDDISPARAPRGAHWLATELDFEPGKLAYVNATADFDRRVMHLEPRGQ